MRSYIIKFIISALILGEGIYIFSLHSENAELQSKLNDVTDSNIISTGAMETSSNSPDLLVTEAQQSLSTSQQGSTNPREIRSGNQLLGDLSVNRLDVVELDEEERAQIQRELAIQNLSDPENRERSIRMSIDSQYGDFIDSLLLSSDEEVRIESLLREIHEELNDLLIQRLRGEVSMDEYRNYPYRENVRSAFEGFLSSEELDRFDEFEAGRDDRNRQRRRDILISQIAIQAPRLSENNRESLATIISDELYSLQQSVQQDGDERINLLRVAHQNAVTKLVQNGAIDENQLPLAVEYLQEQINQLPETLDF